MFIPDKESHMQNKGSILDYNADGIALDLYLSKALFSLYPDNLQLYWFLRLGTLFCCSFFHPLDQPWKTLQTVQVTPGIALHCTTGKPTPGSVYNATTMQVVWASR